MAPGYDSCLAGVAEAGGMSREEAQGVLDGIDDRAQRIARERGLELGEATRTAVAELTAEEKAAAAIERRNTLLNLRKRVARRQTIADVATQLGKPGRPDFATAVRNQVVAIFTPVKGARFSAEAFAKTRSLQYVSGLTVALQKAGLLKAAGRRGGQMERQWVRELFERSMQAAGHQDAQPGVTGNKVAQQIAETIHGFQSMARENLNRQGAWIGDYAGYVTRTSHDMDKIRRAGFDAWRAMIEPRLDERTFEGVASRESFLRSTWSALASGVHLSDAERIDMKDGAFTGPRNMAGAASEQRVLHFKDSDGWLDYQHEFGTGTPLENIVHSFERAARQEALMSRWGTNPEAEFQADLRYLSEEYRDARTDLANPHDAHIESVVALRDKQASLQLVFDMLTGKASQPQRAMAADIMSGLRIITSMSKLGSVAFTHLGAIGTKASEMRYQGAGYFTGAADGIASLFRGRGKGEARELADLLLAGAEGYHGKLLSRFQVDDSRAGTMSRLSGTFFNASGLTYELDAQKAGAMRVMSRLLGRNVGTAFEQLSSPIQRGLRMYDISPAEWDRLRTAPDHVTVNGRTHLTPDAAHRSTIASDDGARDQLALKLHAYFADVADRSIVTPGIAERALLLGRTSGGTLPGEAMRFVSQFKTWGFAAARQGLGRELYGGQGKMGAVSGVLHMALGCTMMGYITMTLKDLFKGLTPRDPLDVRTWEAAAMQGGGFGIFGDYLFGEYSRTGSSFAESLAGPVMGQAATDVMRLWDDFKGATNSAGVEHARKDIPADLLHIGMSNLPFVNLFYIRAALNYLFIDSLQETISPGYLRRSERSLKKQTGQTHMLSPSLATVMPWLAGPPSENHLRTFGR